MPPLIATLGVQTSLRGLAYIVTGGLPVYGFTKAFGSSAIATINAISIDKSVTITSNGILL